MWPPRDWRSCSSRSQPRVEVAFRFNAPKSENDIELGANLRCEIFLVFKESVNNRGEGATALLRVPMSR
ncbi:MAG TPA: hypothetical protein VF747_07265 [Blastocatellia bacterium]